MKNGQFVLVMSVGCALVGCGSNGASDDGAGTGSPQIVASGQVQEFGFSGESTALEGAEVCLLQTGECTTTDADGGYELIVPASTEGTLSFKADGYFKQLAVGQTDAQDMTMRTAQLVPDSLASLVAAQIGTPYPNEAQGIVTVFVYNADGSRREGATLESMTGGGKVYFMTPANTVDISLTETSEAGFVGVAEVEPGDQTFRLGGTAGEHCESELGWSTDGDTVTVPVRGGFQTLISFVCSD